jgi:hypothetical protein
VKEDEMDRACNTNEVQGECRKDIGGKARRKRPLGRPRSRRVGNIKIDLREIGWNGVDWIDLPQDRNKWRAHVNTVMSFRLP